MRSKVRFNQEIDTLNTIQIKSNSDEAQIFKNMEILCKYYSKIHLVSYLHLQFINNMMLIIFILALMLPILVMILWITWGNRNYEQNRRVK